jgi:hypothetical protein
MGLRACLCLVAKEKVPAFGNWTPVIQLVCSHSFYWLSYLI